MRIRGRRECAECGKRWSYYETGSVACPACGSARSVATTEAGSLHTDAPADLDLDAARRGIDERPLQEVTTDAADAARSYLADRGFVRGGELLDLDDTVLAAAELRAVADHLRRGLDPAPAVERHFLALLRGADDGERPDDVPGGLRAARGLAVADAVGRYRADCSRWLDEHPDPEARTALGHLRDHEKRIGALDGDVPPEDADRLVAAARDLGAYLRAGDESALARARDRLSRLA